MQFKFDANQEFQVKAVESVVNLLEGRQRISGTPVYLGMADSQGSFLPPEQRGQYFLSEIFPGTIANSLTLPEDDLLANLNKVQLANSLGKRRSSRCLSPSRLSEGKKKDKEERKK
jgi:hypothetical protein